MCEQKTVMITNTGQITEDEEGIKEMYMELHETLLATKKATSTREGEAESDVNRTFNTIESIALKQKPTEIKEEHIIKVVKKLSRRKASDRQERIN